MTKEKQPDSKLNKSIRELLLDEIKLVEQEREFNRNFKKKILISIITIVFVFAILILFSLGLNYFAGTVEYEPSVIQID